MKKLSLVSLLVAVGVLAACSKTEEKKPVDAVVAPVTEAVKDTATKTTEMAKDATKATTEVAKDATKATAEVADKAKAVAGAAVEAAKEEVKK